MLSVNIDLFSSVHHLFEPCLRFTSFDIEAYYTSNHSNYFIFNLFMLLVLPDASICELWLFYRWDSCSSKSNLPSINSHSGLLFSIGGRGKGGDPFSKIEVYSWLENRWTPGPRLLMPRRHVAAAVIDGIIYAVGGHNGSEHLNTVESFNPECGSWQLCKPMGICRRGMSVGVLNGMLYAIGGLDESVCFNRVERFVDGLTLNCSVILSVWRNLLYSKTSCTYVKALLYWIEQ